MSMLDYYTKMSLAMDGAPAHAGTKGKTAPVAASDTALAEQLGGDMGEITRRMIQRRKQVKDFKTNTSARSGEDPTREEVRAFKKGL